MSATVAAPASRNAPCPCGSGRRYKECHGRPSAPAARTAAVDDATAERLHAALAAQQGGRVAEAIAIYDDVIARVPAIFDAWHMRGVAHFQLMEFDAAERDIRRTLDLRPDLFAARNNLSLVLEGRRIARQEAALCRETLPRYGPLLADPPLSPFDGTGAGTRVFVLGAGARAGLVEALVRDAAARGADVTTIAVGDGRAIEGDEAARLAATSGRDVVVCAGCARPLGDWTLDARPGVTALVCDGADLASFIDRLREVSGQARRRVRVAVAADASIDLRPLPHVRSDAW
ncbi:hypothetical protein BURK1_02212 [Burkholderiales bacterium]|nr:hypothetical protein BURK1_02212 [Burkholderiales bacterium]